MFRDYLISSDIRLVSVGDYIFRVIIIIRPIPLKFLTIIHMCDPSFPSNVIEAFGILNFLIIGNYCFFKSNVPLNENMMKTTILLNKSYQITFCAIAFYVAYT